LATSYLDCALSIPRPQALDYSEVRYSPGVADREELPALIRRLVDRLGTLSVTRLAARVDDDESRAKAAHAAAGRLAEFAQGVEERSGSAPPDWRQLPWIADTVVADQLAVVGTDLARALQGVADDALVWTRVGRRTATEVLDAALSDVRRVKQLVG
jgi:hypothetical protein